MLHAAAQSRRALRSIPPLTARPRASVEIDLDLYPLRTLLSPHTSPTPPPTTASDPAAPTPLAQVMRAAEAVSILRGLHGATALGALAALLSLPQATLTSAIVYMSARDLLSAAVRLGLLGPLAAVPLQQDIVQQIVVDAPAGAAPNGISATSGADPTLLADPTADPISMAAGSAPLLEAAHACHDLLERRIFQT